MTEGVHVYALDTDQLKKVFGSKDKQLLSDLNETYRSDILHYNKKAEEFIEREDFVPVEVALEKIIYGDFEDDDGVPFFGIALELICKHSGEALQSSSFLSVKSNMFYDHAVLDNFFDGSADPDFTNLFPRDEDISLGGYSQDIISTKLDAVLEFLESKPVLKDPFDKLDYTPNYNEYIEWLQFAQTHKKGLVSFYF